MRSQIDHNGGVGKKLVKNTILKIIVTILHLIVRSTAVMRLNY